jgi:hypothetical protein
MRRFTGFACLALGVALLASPALANVTHVVAFKYKTDVKPEQKADFARRFFALKDSARRQGNCTSSRSPADVRRARKASTAAWNRSSS